MVTRDTETPRHCQEGVWGVLEFLVEDRARHQIRRRHFRSRKDLVFPCLAGGRALKMMLDPTNRPATVAKLGSLVSQEKTSGILLLQMPLVITKALSLKNEGVG